MMLAFSPELSIFALSVVCHGFAVLEYFLAVPSLGLPPQWTWQFLALVAASFLVSIVACATSRKKLAYFALAAQLACLLLIASPSPSPTSIEILLGAVLVLEIASFVAPPAHAAAGLFVDCLLTFMRRPSLLWGQQTGGKSVGDLILLGTTLTVILVIALLLRRASSRQREAVREIEHLDDAIDRIVNVNASFQDALVSMEIESSALERKRITREIHDIVGYTLTNQQMMIEASLLLAGSTSGRLTELLLMAKEGVSEGLQETRKTLYALRSVGEGAVQDLNLLQKVATTFERVTGVRVSIEFTNIRNSFDERTRLTLHRLIQESLINALRHGKARKVSVHFWEEDNWITVAIHDDGIGAPNIEEGIGLKGMRERVSALGGELSAGNALDGFVVRVRLPVEVREKEAAI
jgi:signal transduction histidine kinase